MTTPLICLRCSTADIRVDPQEIVDGHILDKHTCVACGYTWYMDHHPVAYPKPELFVPHNEKRLMRENEMLREIIDNQAKVIADYQEMVVVK